ncbi:hypothetical protein H1S01_18190 [Heliobacterium chlorum]|uniref:Holin n=1 Tax=Heliobacterium chlorum TaxID=2698 RepID=A0ABR7T6J8_HELCL|nr:hypothetical protein [Heliobacterium chlorum]MBC9786388.1 hypothetical protein [Heliobacterium chlorum]
MFDSTIIIGLIVALGQLAKGYMEPKYIPAISLVLGVIAGLFLIPADTIQTGVVNGLMAGLSACGLYDVSKSIHVE